ncbi:MAG: helix-turn-helix domain-containing protein [Trueperaceae bacterium]
MSKRCRATDPACPVTRAIAVLQEKWVLHIVHALLDGPRGFNELGREVGGCNPTTLTLRLARLEEAGLVMRVQEVDGGSRSSYALTDAGAALSDVIQSIRSWSVQYLHHAEPAADDGAQVDGAQVPSSEPAFERPFAERPRPTGSVMTGPIVQSRTQAESDARARASSVAASD